MMAMNLRLCFDSSSASGYPSAPLDQTFFGEDQLFMPTIRVKENEPFEVALRRFKRSCEKAGVLTEVRRREFYEKPTEERKRKAAAARKRSLKRMRRQQMRLVRMY